jgi:DnaB-like helicase C terminal domain
VLSASRALALNVASGRPLPKVDALRDLYAAGTTPRHGEVIMVAGRSGTQKSGFALWLCNQLGLRTHYFSADMSPFTASARVASTRSGMTTDEVEKAMANPGSAEAQHVEDSLRGSKISFAFGSPITYRNIDTELDAYVELHDENPEIICFDNLMDFDEAEADYGKQMEVMQLATELARKTGATTLILHHASDKSLDAKLDPYLPPGRRDIKNGMAEKPELALGVGLNPHTLDYYVATLKQRMGPSDASGRTFITMKAEPALTRFHARTAPTKLVL